MSETDTTLDELGRENFRATVAICPQGLELWSADASPTRFDFDGKQMVPYCPNHRVDCVIHSVVIQDPQA